MRSTIKWYRDLKEALGPDYTPLVDVPRPSDWPLNIRPKIESYGLTEERHYLSWPSIDHDGSGSASPAHQHGFHLPDADPEAIIRRVTETLALPGIASDYHFTIQNGHTGLRKYRKADPDLYDTIETLCLLDIKLIERYPSEVFGESEPFSVSAFHVLSQMYKVEGRLSDALDILRRGAPFRQGNEKRIEALEMLVEA